MNRSEICKAVARIEGLNVATPREASSREWNEDACIILPHGSYGGGSYPYNPMADDAMCFKLMIKYKVECKYIAGDLHFFIPRKTGLVPAIGCHTPNEAICLVIIESKQQTGG